MFIVGHGQSEGERVYIDSVDTYVQDVVQHIVEMKKRYPDLPCLLMGHSMVSSVWYWWAQQWRLLSSQHVLVNVDLCTVYRVDLFRLMLWFRSLIWYKDLF